MNILGINAFHGDASAALLVDGDLAFAVEEERFNRIKHCAGFPRLAINSCLRGVDPREVTHVAISRNPRAHLWRKLLRVATRPNHWSRMASRAGNNLRVARLGHEMEAAGINLNSRSQIHHVEHHRAHLASAFFASPFEEAAVVSVDGFGDFSSVMWGVGRGNEIKVLGSVQFPHSLGIFYTAFTQFLGFPKYGDEYKMMGLAAYGMPVYRGRGVALNCAANGKIFERTPFQEVYVQPAAHDAGTSIGAALYVAHQVLKRPRSFIMRHVYYGPEHSQAEISAELEGSGVAHQRLDQDQLLDRTAREIADGKIVGWFQGRMEFGPRALGNRSILADPRRKEMKDILNRRIKYREPFRPFCPSILAEATSDYFEIDYPSPFMVMAYKIKPPQRERIPAVTHGDGTGRLQTVEKDVNPLYWGLIKRFEEITGVPVLLNTSFNENEPIVNTPAEALDCFLRTQMDVLVMGPYLLLKSENLRLSESREALAAVARGLEGKTE